MFCSFLLVASQPWKSPWEFLDAKWLSTWKDSGRIEELQQTSLCFLLEVFCLYGQRAKVKEFTPRDSRGVNSWTFARCPYKQNTSRRKQRLVWWPIMLDVTSPKRCPIGGALSPPLESHLPWLRGCSWRPGELGLWRGQLRHQNSSNRRQSLGGSFSASGGGEDPGEVGAMCFHAGQSVVGCWLLVVGCWLFVAWCWLFVVRCSLLGFVPLQEAFLQGHPFHAVLGYSQGASLAALAASKLCKTESGKNLQWILISGWDDPSWYWKKQGHFGKVPGWLVVHILRCRLSTTFQGNEVPSWSFEYAAFFCNWEGVTLNLILVWRKAFEPFSNQCKDLLCRLQETHPFLWNLESKNWSQRRPCISQVSMISLSHFMNLANTERQVAFLKIFHGMNVCLGHEHWKKCFGVKKDILGSRKANSQMCVWDCLSFWSWSSNNTKPVVQGSRCSDLVLLLE